MAILAALPSCVAVSSFIQAYSEIGMSESDRAGLLTKTMKDYGNAVYWGDAGKILAFSTEDFQESLKGQLRKAKGKERVVETEVDFVDFKEESNLAEVDFKVKYYKVPYYVVEERRELLTWKFDLGSGWKLSAREELPVEKERSQG
jgi:hypothetical protein